MDKIVQALAAPFAAGFAVQRLLEILDPLFEKVKPLKDNKKLALALISLTIGLLLSFAFGLRVLQPLGVTGPAILDAFATALIVSAGTEGFNSILKILGYSKEEKKAEAAEKISNVEEKKLSMLQKFV
jgi:hypothetical protein